MDDHLTKSHDPARCLFHVCLGRIPNIRDDIVNEYSGSSSSFIHLLHDVGKRIQRKAESKQALGSYKSSLENFISVLHDSQIYHHQFFRSFMFPYLNDFRIMRDVKRNLLKMKLMYDLWWKEKSKFILPIETYYMLDDMKQPENHNSMIGHRSYLVIDREKKELFLFDTSQLKDFPDSNRKNGAFNRLIAMRFEHVDYYKTETINSIVDVCVNHTVPLSTRQVAAYNDNEVERIVNLIHTRLAPRQELKYDPHYIRKGQLYGTCTYSPLEKMISTWYPKEDAKQLKKAIRREIYYQCVQEINTSSQYEEYIVEKAKSCIV